VLFAGADVAAVIDFEEARLDHRIDELARSAVLLGTRFHNWAPSHPRSTGPSSPAISHNAD